MINGSSRCQSFVHTQPQVSYVRSRACVCVCLCLRRHDDLGAVKNCSLKEIYMFFIAEWYC